MCNVWCRNCEIVRVIENILLRMCPELKFPDLFHNFKIVVKKMLILSKNWNNFARDILYYYFSIQIVFCFFVCFLSFCFSCVCLFVYVRDRDPVCDSWALSPTPTVRWNAFHCSLPFFSMLLGLHEHPGGTASREYWSPIAMCMCVCGVYRYACLFSSIAACTCSV